MKYFSVYGCIHIAGRKVIGLCFCTDNCDPKRNAGWCFDYLFEKRIVPERLRIDKSFGTGNMTTIHPFLRSDHVDLRNPSKSAIDKRENPYQLLI